MSIDQAMNIAVECHADSYFVNRLLDGRQVFHAGNNGQAIEHIEKAASKQPRPLAIIDGDKRMPSIFGKDYKANLIEENGYFSVYKHSTQTCHVLVLKDAGIERFLLGCIREIDMKKYRNKSDEDLLKELKRICKDVNAAKNADLQAIVSAILAKKCPGALALKAAMARYGGL